MRLSLSNRTISAGETLAFRLRVYNRGPDPVGYWWGHPEADFWVKGPGGLIWVWSQALPRNSEFTAELIHSEIRPGQSRHAWAPWRNLDCERNELSLPPGDYLARAGWTASLTQNGSGRWWSKPVVFEIR